MGSTKFKTNKFTAENWEIIVRTDRDYFTADEVIDAYFKGKEDGLSQTGKVLMRSLTANVEKTVRHRNTVFEFLQENKFNPITSYLNIISWDTFEILIVVSEKEFLDDKFLKVYNFVSNLEKTINEDLYNLVFRFTNLSENFDESKLESGGFILKHQFAN